VKPPGADGPQNRGDSIDTRMAFSTRLDLSLRLAVPVDARCIGVLGTQVFLDTYAPQGVRPLIADEVLEHFSTDAIAHLLAQPATVFIVAESAGHLIGFAQLTRGAKPPQGDAVDSVELARLYVLERFAGRGVGTRLLRESERWAVSTDASMIWLTAWVGNGRALAFYAAQGYADTGTTFYDFQGELYENRLFVKDLATR
jgi:GNAT superfamily N-acetyltransferase